MLDLGWREAKGYGAIWKGKDGKRVIRAHQASWILHFGPIPEGLSVLHNCPNGDNRACVRPEHLFCGTNADNSEDMAQKGRSTRGRKSGTVKLTEEEVLFIRCMHGPGGLTHRELARQCNVSQTTVFHVIHRQTWAHLIG